MKKTLAGLILILSLSTFAMADEGSSMMGQGMTGQGMMGQGTTGGGMMKMMSSTMGIGGTRWFHHGVSLTLMNSAKLGLGENQKEQLEGIRIKYTKELIRQSAEAQIAEIDIISLLRADTVDLSKVKSAIEKKADIESQVRYLRIEAFEEARRVLTDEQKGKLRKLMENPDLTMGDKAKGMTEGMMGGGKMDNRQK